MLICGLKLTHDSTIALINDGDLVFSYEIEKINNNNRHSEFCLNGDSIEAIFNTHGFSQETVDAFVIDGWNEGYQHLVSTSKNKLLSLPLHSYDPIATEKNLLDVKTFNPNKDFVEYNSYHHISGHAIGAYCSSPYAKDLLSSYILVWDGAIGAQLYYFAAETKTFETIGVVHYMYGCSYSQFANKFAPFDQLSVHDMAMPGKIMAYIAKGKLNQRLLAAFHSIYKNEVVSLGQKINTVFYRLFSTSVISKMYSFGVENSFSGEDMMTTFHYFLSTLLVQHLEIIVTRHPNLSRQNICFSGGCALNIKWNRDIRLSGLFENMWVPPFPNDSGSAIGTACCEMVRASKQYHLNWNTYTGPELVKTNAIPSLWDKIPFTLQVLAKLIHFRNEPVIFLTGRAELGPRALGHRSILASATSIEMKSLLNKFKMREDYRPIAPICLEQNAQNIFNPGTPDPLMLYDHKIRPQWLHRIPAIVHLDGTARLQTVNENQNPEVYTLLKEYEILSGIPLLCNTSANFKGKGFFPDVQSAIEWNECNYIWSEGYLWFKKTCNIEEYL